MLDELGLEAVELRNKVDLHKKYDGLILPGGESTAQGKLIRELGMLDRIRSQIQGGMPVMGTCAGMILLAQQLADDSHNHLGTLGVRVKRNAYGRQLGSFHK